MNRRALAVLTLALALAACATKTPAPVAPTAADWAALAAGDYTCKPKEYVTVDFAVVAAPQAFYDKCVRVRALLKDRRLYRNAAALGHEAGVALFVRDDAPAMDAHAQFVMVSGRLRSCTIRNGQIRDLLARTPHVYLPLAAGGPITVVRLPCDDRDGPALFATEVMAMPTAMD